MYNNKSELSVKIGCNYYKKLNVIHSTNLDSSTYFLHTGTVCDVNEENSTLPIRPAVVVTASPATITDTSEISQLNNTDLTSPEISTGK